MQLFHNHTNQISSISVMSNRSNLKRNLSSLVNSNKVMFNLSNTVALITGGASGIGLATAKTFLKENIKGLCIVDINENLGQIALNELIKSFGDRVIFVKADTSNRSQFDEAFRITIDSFGSLDVVFNNAGIFDDKHWEKEISINICGTLHGTMLAVDEYLPKYKSGNEAVVVNMSSICGLDAFGCAPVYTATKHAIIGLSRSFGKESHYNRTKVRVITICPGTTDTPMTVGGLDRNLGPAYRDLETEFDQYPRQSADVAADAVKTLIGTASTGSVWVIEGGDLYEVEILERQSRRRK
ncbi:15-hydroxyprostaglandin dehydrogenase [NAD(+)]-like isoform X2 [Agrilus planipennis]|uniref:15-hydroxyprostaglandin dehydrogenase [NAD(+)]-like isoform X2 n=1 Tax=Agrilus planipennis TaxID=224129 RepID=A0A1W4WYP1_AGRPL|nr:15-hydroxyprostaglandin dehydrogenase [NAD(+)]-like isoform X2 [Agrilus planipennis]